MKIANMDIGDIGGGSDVTLGPGEKVYTADEIGKLAKPICWDCEKCKCEGQDSSLLTESDMKEADRAEGQKEFDQIG